MTMVSQHGLAAYNKGHRCDDCKAAKRAKSALLRSRHYMQRERVEGDHMCAFCCCWFHPKGINRHEQACQG